VAATSKETQVGVVAVETFILTLATHIKDVSLVHDIALTNAVASEIVYDIRRRRCINACGFKKLSEVGTDRIQ